MTNRGDGQVAADYAAMQHIFLSVESRGNQQNPIVIRPDSFFLNCRFFLESVRSAAGSMADRLSVLPTFYAFALVVPLEAPQTAFESGPTRR